MMHPGWLLNPITSYAAAALCLVLGVTLVIRLKLATARTATLPVAPEDSEVRGLKAEMDQLRESVCRLEETLPVRGPQVGLNLSKLRESVCRLKETMPAREPGVGWNLSKRALALRMHRRGDAVSIIAAALETPSNEIALLVKVHALIGQAETKVG